MSYDGVSTLSSRVSRRLFLPGPLDFVFNPVYLIRRPVFKFLSTHHARVQGDTLDFGCGSMPYRHLFTGARTYLGLDLAASNHGLSQPDATFDGTTIPFEDTRFDSVVSFEVLDDLSHPAVQLAEIHRVLKPGGVFLLTTSFVWELHEEPHDIARYTDHGLRTLLEDSGFDVEILCKEGHYRRAIGQLNAMYWYQTLQKLPFGVLAGVAMAGLVQFLTLMTEHLVPKRRELYLSNLVIARRV